MGPGGSVFGSNMVLFGANRSISFGGGEGGSGGAKRRSFYATPEELMLEEEYYDEQLLPEKKRRLTPDQVDLLERSFEEENKLEPDRKSELAKKLGLQPRQIAVWFQNRRARWKNKQLEHDFDHLKVLYDALLADHDSLILNHHSLASDNQRLRSEVVSLTEKLKMVAPPEQPTHTPILITTLPPTNLEAKDGLSADSAVVVDSGETYNQGGYQVTCGYVMNSEDDSSEDGGNCFATATLGGNYTLLGASVEEEEAAAAAATGTGYWGWSTEFKYDYDT